MQHVQEIDLAWSLIEAAKPELDARERHHVFVSVGAGDSFTAIRILVKLIADKGIPLRPHLVQLCMTWLEAYTRHEDHARLRTFIDRFSVPAADRGLSVIGRSLKCTRQRAVLVACGPAEFEPSGLPNVGRVRGSRL